MPPATKKAASKKAVAQPVLVKPKVVPPARGARRSVDIVSLHVRFELMTKTELRQIIFDLTKKVEGAVTKWKIDFILNERAKKTDAFTQIVKLLVEVDTKLNDKAQKMADEGMTESQASHAIGPAADDAKASAAGTLPPAKANKTVQNSLKQ